MKTVAKHMVNGPPRPRVLLVDDDPGALEWASLILKRAGMQVHAHSSGASALQFLVEEPTHFDAVVLDYLMPEMNGGAVLRALRAIQSDVPAVFASGYARLCVGTTNHLEGTEADRQ